MRIEIFSDMVCPWCYIGKRRLSIALERTGARPELVWRAFQLDPAYPSDVTWTLTDAHLNRYGINAAEDKRRQKMTTDLAAQVGLEYRLDRAIMANTADAHRMVKHGHAHGKGTETAEALMSGFAVEGRNIGDPGDLNAIAAELGLPPLEPGAYKKEVNADLARAAQYGVHGVPSLVVDERYMLVSPDIQDLTGFLEQHTG
ncbi:DsbA family oxidoreductase [Nocardiopsis sp. RSe5-2]|uniref:DsbA family oxidoreductase n=1 Tax=Nocardiopsis endophytica TaxID=3018445 RepID=A0ABT4TWN4_9ACTN|nr:DsbA family oxidoreductase [Nocardiopsis endophytica]MDA2809098.1 DsbA family oxidoreductase [Nocardiopsis endophytica]